MSFVDRSSNLHKGHESVTDPDFIVRGKDGKLNKGLGGGGGGAVWSINATD